MFKDVPELIYTGLTKRIGQPKELEKNLADPTLFDAQIDLTIPVQETTEYIRTRENDQVSYSGEINIFLIECSINHSFEQ